ncbi:MAG: dihydrofolate reductase family protein, partial [Steroidobacteraceae bacterium]
GRERLNEVWSELGATLAGALVTAGLVDELVLYLAPRLLGPDARPLLALPTLSHLADAADWQVCDLRQIGPDIRIILRHDRR